MNVTLLDSTLRDGSQGENIAFSAEDKLKIAEALDELGVGYVECGNPASNPKDAHFFAMLRERPLRRARAVAFGSTCRVGGTPADDAGVRALLDAGTGAVSVFGKASVLHVEEVLRTSREENLRIIRETVAYLKAAGREVLFDAEHFFDGCRLDEDYALSVLRAARDAGADWLAAAAFSEARDLRADGITIPILVLGQVEAEDAAAAAALGVTLEVGS